MGSEGEFLQLHLSALAHDVAALVQDLHRLGRNVLEDVDVVGNHGQDALLFRPNEVPKNILGAGLFRDLADAGALPIIAQFPQCPVAIGIGLQQEDVAASKTGDGYVVAKVYGSSKPASNIAISFQVNRYSITKIRKWASEGAKPKEFSIRRQFPHISFPPSIALVLICLLYTSPCPRDRTSSRMPSSA